MESEQKKISEAEYVGPIQAEQRFGMSRHYWRSLCYQSKIPSFRVGRRRLMKSADCRAHIEAGRVGGDDA